MGTDFKKVNIFLGFYDFFNMPVTFYNLFRKKDFGQGCLQAIIKPLCYKLAIENINILSISPLIN